MRRALTALFLIATLSGCATWVVDSDVRTFSKLEATPPDARYRFERLPSQQVDEAAQQSLESMAAVALGKVGLRRDDAGARYSAQVGARVTLALSPWADPWLYGPGRFGPGGWYGLNFPPASNPWYEREVSLVLRDLASGQVVYETRAHNDGPYNRSADILPVMFEAALQGFPNAPDGERRVNIPLSRQK